MAKPDGLTPLVKARRALRRAGATPEHVLRLELEVLRQVMAESDIGGNASAFVLQRIRDLEMALT